MEAVLSHCGSALLWVTHDESQPGRVGGRQLELPSGVISEVAAKGGKGGKSGAAAGENSLQMRQLQVKVQQ